MNKTGHKSPELSGRKSQRTHKAFTNRATVDIYEEMFLRMEHLNRRLDQHGVKASEDEVFKRSEAILSVADDKSHF
jgi:hypothetical protein